MEMNEMVRDVNRSDLLKILDVLKINEEFHRNRDKMNSAIHLAKEIRFSPITSETISAVERIEQLLKDTIRQSGRNKLIYDKANKTISNITVEEADMI